MSSTSPRSFRALHLALLVGAILLGLALQASATESTPSSEGPSLDPEAAAALPTSGDASASEGTAPIDVAAHHEHEANPCNPCNPCGGKNPCSGNPCNPCGGKNPCNPCGGKNPCGGANPCSGADIDPERFEKPAGLDFEAPSTPEALARGEALWNDRSLGDSGLACATCHQGKYGQMRETFAEPYPHRVAMPAQRAGVAEVDAAEMVNFCMIVPMQSEPLAWGSTELAALTAYVEHIQKGFEPAAASAAGANPCNPCGGAMNPCNPCAGKNPCGGKNPCNPCAGKNPCAGRNPCSSR